MASEEPPVIQTTDLTKIFRNICAVDKVSVTIHQGEVVALLGSNGSGKSTTFRLLLNIYRPSYGRVSLMGKSVESFTGDDFSTIGYISENQKIPQWMKVEEYITYCSQFYPNWDGEYAEQLFDAFKLPKAQKIKHLSRGQKMKACFVSCLPSHPQLLFLDEPFSGLDVETRAQLSDLLAKLTREEKLTTIITTHDVEEIEPIATRLFLLDSGKLVIDEAFSSFKSRYRKLVISGTTFSSLKTLNLHSHRPARRMEGNPESESLVISNYSDKLEEELGEAIGEGKLIENTPVSLREILTNRSTEI